VSDLRSGFEICTFWGSETLVLGAILAAFLEQASSTQSKNLDSNNRFL
jgi:hypothetical protein